MKTLKAYAVTAVIAALAATPSATTRTVGAGLAHTNLRSATQVSGPGDTILMLSGSYAGDQWIADLHGNRTAPILIAAATGATVVVRGGSEAWHFAEVSWVTVHGITFTGQSANGVNVDDGGTYDTPAHHITFDSCTWRDMAATGNNDQLKLSGVDSFTVRNCRFVNGSALGSGVDMVGCHWGLFTGNHFENQGSNSIQAKGGSRYVRIERNVFLDGGERALNLGGSTGLQFFRPDTAHYEAANLGVYSNVFVGSQAPIAFVGCIESEVVNNTIDRPGRWVLRILQETVDSRRFAPCGRNRFVNNIVYRSGLATDCNIGDSTAPATFAFTCNLWYNFATPSSSAPRDLPVADSGSVIGLSPGFADTAARNYSILSTSPAAGHGRAVEQPTLDFAGASFSSHRAIGAYEVVASVHPLLVQRSGRHVQTSDHARWYDVLGRTWDHGRAPKVIAAPGSAGIAPGPLNAR